MVKVEKEEEQLLAKDLKDGQIGIILKGSYEDLIIQKYGKDIVAIGKRYGASFDGSNTLPIRLLKQGETIVITNN